MSILHELFPNAFKKSRSKRGSKPIEKVIKNIDEETFYRSIGNVLIFHKDILPFDKGVINLLVGPRLEDNAYGYYCQEYCTCNLCASPLQNSSNSYGDLDNYRSSIIRNIIWDVDIENNGYIKTSSPEFSKKIKEYVKNKTVI